MTEQSIQEVCEMEEAKGKPAFVFLLLLVCCVLLWGVPGQAQGNGPEVSYAVQHAISPPLRDMVENPFGSVERHVVPLGRPNTVPRTAPQPDPVLQTSLGPLVSTTAGLNFLGVGVGITPTYSDCCAPPDTNGAVGATQFVQWVNLDLAVFSKSTGALVKGPIAGNTFWSSLGGQCAAHNDGDPIAQYDKANGRWVLAQPVFQKPYTYCIAVSTTSDATGTYNQYAFSLPRLDFPDYPKLGIWPDAYYASFNIFKGNSFAGARACTYNGAAMRSGASAAQICFQLSTSFASLLPSDLDGATAPPAGSPDYYVNFGSNSLNLWKFHVDFTTPANSTFTRPTNIPVASFTQESTIPQLDTTQTLDSLSDRVMYRFAYRNFGTYESLLVNHSVTPGNGAVSGVRWYEIRSPGTTPTVFHSCTFAPATNSRCMVRLAPHTLGDIAVGYSVSSSTMHPAIRYSGRVPTDPSGTLETEATIVQGNGSQQVNLNRWGDYSSISIDPSDDCTFWYTTEYLQADGTFNWSTRIASFKFSGCV